MLTLRHPLLIASVLALSLTACDRTEPSDQTPDKTAPPVERAAPEAVAVPEPAAPAGHAEVWAQYIEHAPGVADDDAGWVLDGGGLPAAHLDAMRLNLKSTFRATGWALARSADGARFKLVANFATSGDALGMLTWDSSGARYNTLAAFEPPAEAMGTGAARLADGLIDAALTRLNVVRAQSAAYAVLHDGAAPDVSGNWNALTQSQPPLLSGDPVNPLTLSARVDVAPGPDVGWVVSGAAPLRLSVPAAWIVAYPALAADAAPF